MDTEVSGDDLRDAARRARKCAVVGDAVMLARWIGTGRRPVTAGQVLRKADVAAAGAALGVEVPPKLRTMADIRALHRPWCAGVATGLLRVDDGWATGGPALESWPPGDADLLAGWLAGLRAVCEAESEPWEEDSGRLLARALQETGAPRAGLADLLAEFGAVTGDPGKPAITPLGRWAAEQLTEGLPNPADPGWPARKMIEKAARFGDEQQRARVAWGWLAGREPAAAAREILGAAEEMSPRLRSVAVGLMERLDDDAAVPALRDMAAAPCVGPYARAVLAAWDQGPEPSEADWEWLAAEGAAAALEDQGPDEALSRIWESMPGADLDGRLAAVRATGHPDAETLARAVAEFAASGAPRSIDQAAVLKVSLAYFRPPIWRRVRLPVTPTLADLHVVIQVLFGWDGDHLHLFQVGKKQYSDPFGPLEETEDEDEIRIRDAMAPGGKITYVYDLGTEWKHEITLEKTLPRDPRQAYPVCLAFRGDSPVEYWSEEDPEEPEPFDLAEVNRKLAALGGEAGA